MRLRYRARALADIDSIEKYLSERSPTGARKVLDAIYASTQLIAEHPHSYPLTDDTDVRVHVVHRYRYKVFYIATADMVEIVHVRHSSRRPWTGK